MSRISLRETYDNRSVIAQIAKVTDTAEDAAETVEQKAAEINDAITEVNAAVQAAEGAVTTANAASAAAQQSAQTVAGYNTRLTTAEGEIDTLQSDLNSVTLRVTTAEGNIVTIQGRVTAIEGNYLKKSGDPQTVVSQINVPTTATGIRDTQIANGTRIQNDLDAYAPMLRTTGNQTITGGTKLITGQSQLLEHGKLIRGSNATQNVEYVLATSANASGDARFVIEVITLNSYGIVNVNQNSGVVSKNNILGNVLNYIDFDVDVVDNTRILYFNKLIGADMIVSILNYNVNGVWNGCNIETGYVPR